MREISTISVMLNCPGFWGPQFKGTEKAYLVFFTDQWQELINWASYDEMPDGTAVDNVPEKRKRLPLNLISIELVRRLAEQLNTAYKFLTEDYQKLLPVGWDQTNFFTTFGKSENAELRKSGTKDELISRLLGEDASS